MKPTIDKQLVELLQQMLETELGGVKVYETALQCVQNKDLKKEFEEYHEQTQKHVEIMHELFEKLGLTKAETPGTKVVGHIGASLIKAMKMALESGTPEAAELVACECIVSAETKDHLNWHLLNAYAEAAKGEVKKALTEACEQVEDQEDEHLYHTKGWCRELWIKSLGMKAVLPPPEERKEVKTAIGASRAEQARDEMLKH